MPAKVPPIVGPHFEVQATWAETGFDMTIGAAHAIAPPAAAVFSASRRSMPCQVDWSSSQTVNAQEHLRPS